MKVDQEYSVQKVARMLRLFERLLEGTPLQKGAVAQEFGVSAKTVQRDIEDLRDYFAEYRQGASFLLAYDRAQRGYILQREGSEWLAADEIMGITKILWKAGLFPRMSWIACWRSFPYYVDRKSASTSRKRLIMSAFFIGRSIIIARYSRPYGS